MSTGGRIHELRIRIFTTEPLREPPELVLPFPGCPSVDPTLLPLMSMIHPAKNPQPNGFDLATFAPSLDGVANAAIAEAGNRLADLEEELERSNKFLEDAKAAFKAKVDVLEADLDRYRQMVSPANAIDLGEFIGPIKPCPFCGSVALERDGFEEHIVCKNCGASAPVSGWQFRASIN